jgi:putative ABC transport system permease protein
VRIRFTQGVADTGSMEASLPDLADWQPEVRQLSELAAYASTAGGSVVDFGEETEVVPTGLVTWNLVGLLGVPPLLGRGFAPGDDAFGAAPVALIGEGLWRRRFGGRPDVLGATVRVGGDDCAIVGVMPAEADYPVGSRLWLPVAATVDPALTENRQIAFLNVVGRLGAGASPDSASAELNGIVERVTHPKHPPSRRDRAELSPLREELVGDVEAPLLVLMAAALTVLGIACANVANLQIVRSIARRREYAVRGALGAGWARLLRLSLAESALLSGLGALAGLALARASLTGLTAMSPVTLFRSETIGLDAGAIAFAAALAAATAALFGALPIWHGTRPRLAEALRAGTRGLGTGGRTLDAFVVVQVGLAVVLLVGAGLLVRSFEAMQRVDTGFDPSRTLMADVALLSDAYADPAAQLRFFEELIERAESLPGVEAAGAVLARPFRGPNGFDAAFTIDGRSHEEQARQPYLNYEAATPGYLDAAGIPLLAGRGFADSDAAGAAPVAIVSRAVADRFWPQGDALGARLKWGGPEGEAPWLTVVGIAGDARYRGVETVSLDAYVPFRQSQWPPRTLALRAQGDPGALLPALRAELRRLEPDARLVDAATAGELAASSLQAPRFNTTLLTLFGTLALVIGAVGLYGVLSYNLARRTRELGLRLALGATRGSVLGLALRRGLWLTALGIALGIAGGAAATRLVAGQLFGVSPLDPSTFAATPLLLLAVGAAASLLPAHRASRVDPLAALREE